MESSSGAVSEGQQLEGAQVGDPVVLASRARVGRVIQTEHSSHHIQNTAPHQKIHYYCLDFCTDLPIMLSYCIGYYIKFYMHIICLLESLLQIAFHAHLEVDQCI